MGPHPGTYAIVFTTTFHKRLTIGKLGCLELQAGWYVYVGSAFGPGGLRARIGHHCKKTGAPRWHLDYLRMHLTPVEVWYTRDLIQREHQWAGTLHGTRGAFMPLPGFGSSDCRCVSHFYFFSSRPSNAGFRRKIHAALPGHAAIHKEIVKLFLDAKNNNREK